MKDFLRSSLLFLLCGCLAVPAPVANDPPGTLDRERFEIDKDECEQRANAQGLERSLKPREWAFPLILAGGGFSLGMNLEYGTVFNPSGDPRYDGQMLLGLVAGGLLIGTLISGISYWLRAHAHDRSVRNCLTGRGYEMGT